MADRMQSLAKKTTLSARGLRFKGNVKIGVAGAAWNIAYARLQKRVVFFANTGWEKCQFHGRIFS
jgi:hypothetical protein